MVLTQTDPVRVTAIKLVPARGVAQGKQADSNGQSSCSKEAAPPCHEQRQGVALIAAESLGKAGK